MAKAAIELSAVDKTRAAFDSAKKNLQGLGEQAQGLPAKFGTLGVAIAGVFTAATIKGAVDMLDKLDDLSEKTGISVESLSTLRYAGEVTGTSLESLATGVTKLAKNMADAATGGKETSAAFKSVGVEVKNADGTLRGQDAVLGDLADRFKSYEDGAAKSALAQKIFGKSGADMIPLLNQGSEGIARLKKEAEGLGAVYGGDLAKAAAEFNDNLKKLELNAEAGKVALAGGLLPELNRLLELFIQLKSAAQVWTVIEDGVKRVAQWVPIVGPMLTGLAKLGAVNGAKLTANPQQDILKLVDERAALEKKKTEAEAFAARVNSQRFVSPLDKRLANNQSANVIGFQRDIMKIDDLLEVSRIRQAQTAEGKEAKRLEGFVGASQKRGDAPVAPGGDGAGGGTKKDVEGDRRSKVALELFGGLKGDFIEEWTRLTAMYQDPKNRISLEMLVDAQRKLLAEQPAIKAAADAEKQRSEDLERGVERNTKLRKDYVDGLSRENEQRLDGLRTLAEEVEEIGLTGEALAKVRMARLDANIAREQELAIQARAKIGNEEEADLLEEKVRLMIQARDLKGQAAVKDVAATEAEEGRRRTETISESISQGILEGFRDGQSMADIFLRELKAQFAKTVLQPLI
ncbi:MAG: hypothetical protein V4718_00765, partial [Pseudomonadota bacterium]